MRARVVALAALAALAGCGDELEEFQGHLSPLEQRAEEQRSVTSGLLRSLRLGSRADARSLRAQTAKLADTYDAIAALDPPDDYAEPFADYVQANSAVIRDLRRFAAELQSGDLNGLRQASKSVVGDLSRSQTSSLRLLD